MVVEMVHHPYPSPDVEILWPYLRVIETHQRLQCCYVAYCCEGIGQFNVSHIQFRFLWLYQELERNDTLLFVLHYFILWRFQFDNFV